MENTDPEYWFLGAKEIPRAPPYTSGNDVLALAEGETYFSHLADRLAAMKPGEYLHIAGYRLTPWISLKPADKPPGRSLTAETSALVAKGIIVRVAAWYLPTSIAYFFYSFLPFKRLEHHKDNVRMVSDVIDAASKAKTTSYAILDQRLPFPFWKSPTTLASHHQKNVMLASEGHHWAYVGSIDVAVDRWDTALHVGPPHRAKEYHDAYHDIQCVLRGPATAQIRENFRERWNDPEPPAKWPSPLPIVRPPPIPGAAASVAATYGTHHVQVLRTLACGVYGFAPRGEHTPRTALERAIAKAEHCIYIEEQFVWPCALVDALARAVANNRQLKVIMVVARDLEFGGAMRVAHYEMRNDAVAAITGNSRNQVFVYHLEQLGKSTPIYVHSKLMIIDDRFVGVGSVNINKRSLTTDSELHLGIVDGQIDNGSIAGHPAKVCRFAKSLRVRLWSEHLGLTAGDVDDPVIAVSRWPDWSKSRPGAPSRVHHAVCHHPRTETASLIDWLALVRELRGVVSVPPVFQGRIDFDDIIAKLETAEKTFGGGGAINLVELVLGPQLMVLKTFLKNYVMNIETTC